MPSQFVIWIDDRIAEAENFLPCARASELQQEAYLKLGDVLSAVDAEKRDAIAAGNEDYANLLLGFQGTIQILRSELQMWLKLKEGNSDEAWNHLIDAQMAVSDAVRAHSNFAYISKQRQRLETIEQVIFPPQVFISAGFIVHKQECSICGGEYGKCDHLVSRPYMGRFCHIIAKDAQLDHVSIVDIPADKKCRVREFGCEGGHRNRMTWQIRADDETDVSNPTELVAEQ